ncbi:MAG: hypothetical protein M3O61_19295, partial [Gemmatimonadota bacterium]|nr:hypothetical protein [Gemmatimonadota bacterium]
MAALILVPSQFHSEAGHADGEGLFTRTVSHDRALPNYDIREHKGNDVADYFAAARQSAGKDASAVATTRDDFVRGENDLRTRVPSLKIDYNTDIRIPEVIGPDVAMGRNFLTGPSAGSNRVSILRGFLKENNDLVGVTDDQTDSLNVLADYTNPDGKLSFTHLEQRINNVPV